MKVPTIKSIMFIARRIITLLLDKPKINEVIMLGILVKASTHDIIEDTPIKKIMIPVMFTVFNKISLKHLL